ncbi:Tyrosine recombinase XerC [Comamonas sp. PE63]|uniref:Tyrosine recombinase XerC n=1 Tax=Comamonas brasiliensis TaxID=1812482 RepID=A0ABS5LYP9_9BURK|nr:integrase family protein [Comamonas sp. PE63]MBS3021657.1 Tyrosine recombinase XerC [Comamonas sp. PE63]
MNANSNRVRLTAGRIAAFTCPVQKSQAFLWDTEVPALMLRATPSGRKTYAFESRLFGKTLRIGIGPVESWTLEQAREQGRNYSVLVDKGQDPRELEIEQKAQREEQRQRAKAEAITVGDVWPRYLENGRPKRRDAWKPRYFEDLQKMAAPGGVPKKRGQGLTRPGPLYPLLALPLAAINEDSLKRWHDKEAKSGKHQAARALMMFRGFLRWCASQPEYRAMTDREAGQAPAIVQNLPAMTRRTDALETAQVEAWWSGVEQLDNRTASAYLRALLLTGARREEMAALRWKDVDFRWRKLTLSDKVEDSRTIPLTPYLRHLLLALPRTGEFVFASSGDKGHIVDVRASHAKALKSAAIERLTFHGLRRSFSLLGEAAGAPAGAIAQVMGHKPSATAEGYRPRSVDALRPFLERIEAWILDQAGVQFDTKAEPGQLRAMH